MSSSPVELLEGCRLNQTKGLSLLATVPVSAVEESSFSSEVVETVELLDDDLSPVLPVEL